MIANYNTVWLSLKDTLLHIIWAEDNQIVKTLKSEFLS